MTSPAAAARYLDIPEQGRIAYDVAGTGPVVVLVPGMGELRSTYRHLAPLLIEAGCTVVTTDLRGHGGSDAAFPSFGDTETAADIAALIAELGRPAVIVGNSMAAGSAVIVAADHPELVTGLVLVGPFVRNPPMTAAKGLLMRVMMAQPWAAAAWKAFLPSLYAGAKPADFEEYRSAAVAAIRRPGYARAFGLTTRTDHAPAEARLDAVRAPALVVMGAKDPDFSDQRGEAEWIAARLGGDVVMVPDAGHYPHSQQPALTAQAVVGFLARTGGARG